MVDGSGMAKFRLLSKFMCDLVLPHSPACVERIFSQLNLVKTKQRNCLKNQNVTGRLLAKQLLLLGRMSNVIRGHRHN